MHPNSTLSHFVPLICAILLLLPFSCALKWNIGFVSVPMRGHLSPLIPIADQLIKRGHQVSFFVPKSLQSWIEEDIGKSANLRISVVPECNISQALVEELFSEYSQTVTTFDHPFDAATSFANYRLFTEFFSQENVDLFHSMDRIFNNTPINQRPHLLVIDPFTTAGFDVARKYDIDWAIFHPGLIFLLEHFVGSNQPWIARSNSGFPQKMSLFQRIINPFIHHSLVAALFPTIIQMNAARAALPGVQIPSHPFEDFEKKLIISGSTYPLQIPRELPPTVQMVGPSRPKSSGKHLPKVIQDFLQNKDRVILICFGTIAVLSDYQIKSIYNGIKGHNVIWALKSSQKIKHQLRETENLLVLDWIPQYDLLKHEKVAGLISHCGASSAHESMFAGVPLICVPFFADQFDFAQRVQEFGSGIYLEKFSFTPELIAAAIHRIITEKSFKTQALKAGHIFRAAEGEVKAADLIEYKLRFGIDHWVSATEKQPFYSSFFVDISFAIFAITILLIGYFSFKLCSLLCCSSSQILHKKQA